MQNTTHNRLLRLVVAMESALADGRYDEAAHLRDEYKRALQEQEQQAAAAAASESSSTADSNQRLL
jgi:protein-arginine kinase activator protein McsA